MRKGLCWLICLTLIQAWLLSAGPWAWGAGCYENCQNSCRGFSGHVTSQSCVDTCFRQYCEKKASYGAIAFGPESQAYGYSHGYDSRAEAERAALRQCQKHANDCQVMVWFERKCGAVAAREDNNLVYWGMGNSTAEAGRMALAECNKDNGRNCQVKVSHCSR